MKLTLTSALKAIKRVCSSEHCLQMVWLAYPAAHDSIALSFWLAANVLQA